MLRTVLLVAAFATGWFCPSLALLKPLMPWCLGYMLTVVFMRTEFSRASFSPRQALVIAVNIAMAVAVWGGMLLCGVPERFAQAAFFTAITPTASAAPVIVSLLGGSIGFASFGFVLSALAVSAALPLLVPMVLHQSAWGMMPLILMRVGWVVFLPMFLGGLLRRLLGGRAARLGRRLTASTLYAWIALVAIIAASASDFLRTHAAEYPVGDVLWVLLIDFVLCVVCFAVGALLGYPGHTRECSQLLGQKNTSYTTYLAFASGNPFAALGPAFYVFFHNAWNGLQLIFHKEQDDVPKKTEAHR